MVSNCPKCGKGIHDEAFVYCPYCGIQLGTTVSRWVPNGSRFLRKIGYAVFVFGIVFIIVGFFAAYFCKTYDFGTFKYTTYPLADYVGPLGITGVMCVVAGMISTALSRSKMKAY